MIQRIVPYALPLCCILALVSIGAMQSFVSKPNNKNPMKEQLDKKNYQSDFISRQQRQRRSLYPIPPNYNEMKLDLKGMGQAQRGLEDSWSLINNSTFTSSCSICGNLGVPLLDKFIPMWNATCSQMDDYYFATLPMEECRAAVVEAELLCCDQSGLLPPYECEQQVRHQILGSYDTAVAPMNVDTRIVEIDTFITFYYLSSVDVTTSSIALFLEVDQTWNDPRLAWNMSSNKCVTSIAVRASHDPEKTDIWTPMAFDLKNKAKGVQEFPDFVATVFSDGTVRWSRMGFVEAMCTFVGLRMMPFDQLGCQLHFTGGQQRLKLNLMERESATGGIDRGFGIGDYQQSYTEHKLIPENLKCDYYLGDPYETDIDSGERLPFGVTVVLIMVTQSIAVSSLLPLCQEMLWINKMNFSSMVFTILALVSTLVGLGITRFENMVANASSKPSVKDEYEENEGIVERRAIAFLHVNEDDAKSSNGPDSAVNTEELGRQRRGLLKLIVMSKTSSDMLLAVDKAFCILLPIAYLLFLIIMFATLKGYNDEQDPDGRYKVWKYWMYQKLH